MFSNDVRSLLRMVFLSDVKNMSNCGYKHAISQNPLSISYETRQCLRGRKMYVPGIRI